MTVTASPDAKYSKTSTHRAVFARLVDDAGTEIGGADDYEFVSASDTDEPVFNTAGSRLYGLLIIPGTTSPGAVSIEDGTGTNRVVFAGGADSVLSLHPFYVPFGPNGIVAAEGWEITTGSNVTAFAFGKAA